MKKLYLPLPLICLLVFTSVAFAQVTPPPPPNPGDNPLFDADPDPVIGEISFSPSPMTDVLHSGSNLVSVKITDDSAVETATLHYGQISGAPDSTLTLILQSDNQWEASLPLLPAGDFYYTISAKDDGGQLVASAEAIFQILEGAPLAPANLAISRTTASSFLVSWDAAEKATAYRLEISLASDYSVPLVQTELNSDLQFQADGLQAATQYFVRVKALRNTLAGTLESSWSETNITTSEPLAEEPLNFPDNFRAVPLEGNRYNLFWTQLPDGVLADGFLIRIYNENSAVPVDGFAESEELDFTDGVATRIVADTDSCIVNIPGSEMVWTAKIYPFKGNNSSVNYKTTPVAPELNITLTAAAGVNAWINEIHYDNAGTDASEMVEVVIEKSSDYRISDFQIVLYNGGDGRSYSTKSLPQQPDASVSGFDIFNVAAAGMQNGPDGVTLVYKETVLQFISYGGVFTAVGGVADGMTSVQMPVQETTSTPAGFSLQLTGSGSAYHNFSWSEPQASTAGAANTGQSFTEATPVSKWIGAISSNWFDAGNWDNGIPSLATKVVIAAGKPYDLQLTSAAECKVLVLESDACMTGQQFLPEKTILQLQRQLSAKKWLYLTPPVLGSTVYQFKPGAGLTYVIAYDNEKPYSQSPWSYIQDTTKLVIPATGYGFLSTREDLLLSFSGLPLRESLLKELYFKADGNNWNFLGNPFLGALNWRELSKEFTTGSAYLYDPNNKTYIAVAADGVTTDPSFTDQIPPMQGFFIESTAIGNFIFDIQKTVTSNQYFLKEGSLHKTAIRLKVRGPQGCDFAVILFDEQSNAQFQPTEDSRKLQNVESGVPQVAFIQGDERVAIGRQPFDVGELPLRLTMPDATQVEISVSVEGQLPNGFVVTLVDKLAGRSIDLAMEQTLRAVLTESDLDDRFALVIRKNEIIEPEKLPFRIYSKDEEIRLESPDVIVGYISIFNLAGQMVAERPINGTSALFSVGKGQFIIRLQTEQKKHVARWVVP